MRTMILRLENKMAIFLSCPSCGGRVKMRGNQYVMEETIWHGWWNVYQCDDCDYIFSVKEKQEEKQW